MGTVTRAYSETDGAIAEASSVNRVIDDLYTLVNGNLTGASNANIAGSGVLAQSIGDTAILTRHLNDCAVTSLKIGTCQVLGSNVATGVFTFTSLDYDHVIFSQEVI